MQKYRRPSNPQKFVVYLHIDVRKQIHDFKVLASRNFMNVIPKDLQMNEFVVMKWATRDMHFIISQFVIIRIFGS